MRTLTLWRAVAESAHMSDGWAGRWQATREAAEAQARRWERDDHVWTVHLERLEGEVQTVAIEQRDR